MRNTETTPGDPTVREQLQGVTEFLRRALRHWPAVLVTLLVGGAAFLVFLELHQPRFRSETVILYVEKGHTTDDTESSDVERAVTTRLRELLFARPSLERVVTQFGLYPELHRSYGMVDAAEELKKHVQFRAPGGDTFSIAFEGNAAAQAQGVTAELARQVIDGDATLRRNQAKVALDFLVGERQARDLELRAAEEKLAGFMAKHPRFALDATPLANGAAVRASMGGAVGAPGAPKTWAPSSSNAAPAARQAAPVSVGAPNTGSRDGDEARARAALAAARETLTERLVHYTPAHPDVRAAEADVQRAQQRLAAITGGGPAAPTTSDAPPASSGAAAPLAEPAPSPRPAWANARPAPAAATPSAADSAQTLVDLETEWLKLTRAVSEARQRLDQIEEQLFRADIEVSSETGGHGVQVSVIDPAFLPERPLPPGPFTLGLLFAGGALVVGALAALVLAALDQRIFTLRDANAILPVLVEVPRDPKRRAYVTS